MDISQIEFKKACICGAVTIELDNRETFSMSKKTFKTKFPYLRMSTKEKWYNCNHCINCWGIDLCGCGSGEEFGKCKEGTDECDQPSQMLPENGFSKLSPSMKW